MNINVDDLTRMVGDICRAHGITNPDDPVQKAMLSAVIRVCACHLITGSYDLKDCPMIIADTDEEGNWFVFSLQGRATLDIDRMISR